MKLPRRIQVKEVLSSRYTPDFFTDISGLNRPASWDERVAGKESILTAEGETIDILSSGAQSTPQNGWEILLMSGDSQSGFSWTLYGLPKNKI